MDYCKGRSHKHFIRRMHRRQQRNTHSCCVFAPTRRPFFFAGDINLNCCWRLNADLNVSTGTTSSLKYRSSTRVGVCWRYCTCTCSWSDKGRVGGGEQKDDCAAERLSKNGSPCVWDGGSMRVRHVCKCVCVPVNWHSEVSQSLPSFLHQSAMCTSKSADPGEWEALLKSCCTAGEKKNTEADEEDPKISQRLRQTAGGNFCRRVFLKTLANIQTGLQGYLMVRCILRRAPLQWFNESEEEPWTVIPLTIIKPCWVQLKGSISGTLTSINPNNFRCLNNYCLKKKTQDITGSFDFRVQVVHWDEEGQGWTGMGKWGNTPLNPLTPPSQ